MKSFIFSLSLLISHYAFSQSAMGIPPDYISHSNIGTITLSATSFADKKNAPTDAIKSAFNALLFHGIAGAPKPKLRAPFIRHEKEAWEKHPVFLQDLFHQNGYMRYLDETGNPKKSKIKALGNKKAYQLTLTINYEALLRDLRKEGIIPQPGF